MTIDERWLRFCGKQFYEEDFVQAEAIFAVNHVTGNTTIYYGLAWFNLSIRVTKGQNQ